MPRRVPFYCHTARCPERGIASFGIETPSAGRWWPAREYACWYCGAPLQPDEPAVLAACDVASDAPVSQHAETLRMDESESGSVEPGCVLALAALAIMWLAMIALAVTFA